ncbi:securin SCDLUD_001701 [Saccharomycodes ludwigii]|uniref:securin n=1 Tax=Saccharomycodes ludwigii TaxID=36035 RepID=UPI001E87207B|nr:hypothetical protein SCDLUD_001701 [Saccharomycodes ludwigii]KAH3901917.1 hypothetical protein SCDLUD_001701 [Saccharomycodes ludwigii]
MPESNKNNNTSTFNNIMTGGLLPNTDSLVDENKDTNIELKLHSSGIAGMASNNKILTNVSANNATTINATNNPESGINILDARKPLANKDSNRSNSLMLLRKKIQQQPLQEIQSTNTSNIGSNNNVKKPKSNVKVTHTGSFSNNAFLRKNMPSTLTRKKSLVLKDTEEGSDTNAHHVDNINNNNNNFTNLRSLLAKTETDNEDQMHATNVKDSANNLAHLLRGLKEENSNIRRVNDTDNVSPITKENTNHSEDSDYDSEIEFVPQKQEPMKDFIHSFDESNTKKLNTFSSPFSTLIDSGTVGFSSSGPHSTDKSDNFKLLPINVDISSSSDLENSTDTIFTNNNNNNGAINSTNSVSIENNNNNNDGLASLDLEIPEYDGNGLTNEELDSLF